METLEKIYLLAYPLALLLQTLVLYKSKRKYMMTFCRYMAYWHSCRKVYTLVLCSLVLLYDKASLDMTGDACWHLPPFILSLSLLSHRLFSAIIRWLHEERVCQMLFLALVMATLIVPQMLPLSVVLLTVYFAAIFHPSERVIKTVGDPLACPEFAGTEEEILDMYYETPRIGRWHHVTHRWTTRLAARLNIKKKNNHAKEEYEHTDT